MTKKRLKYPAKGFRFLINLPLFIIGWTLIGMAKAIRVILLKYYQLKIHMGWQIQ